MYKTKKKWRKKNPHNETTIKNIFPLEKVKVGKYTYGELNIKSWGSENEKLEIGNFVSIAEGVIFILGGNHNIKTLSTFPIKTKIFKRVNDEVFSKGKIVVEDDVWIGMNTLILSGIKIGKGAIVGAGSVVTKDIPPYSIVGGNPARVLKYRFSKEIIEKIKDIDLQEIDLEKKIKFLYQKLTEKNTSEIVKKLKKGIDK